MAIKFYKCEVCGNIVCKIEDKGTPLTCCQRQMHELRPASTDGALEKHVPVYTFSDGLLHVEVGSTLHPMESSHYIDFIVLEKHDGFQLQWVKDSANPIADFMLDSEDDIVNIYAYCNLHGIFSLK